MFRFSTSVLCIENVVNDWAFGFPAISYANHVKPSLLFDNSDIWTLKYEKGLCEQMAKLDPQIAIAALIDEKGQPVDWHVKEGVPVPKEDRSSVMPCRP
jgi:hypothetical protein